MSNQILVVAAHPDDEVLGCGGTLARHCADGDRVSLLFLADGVGARGSTAADLGGLSARRTAGNQAARRIGADDPIYLDFPDNRLDTVPLLDLVQAIEDVASKLSPTQVYTHHAGDLNIDHRICNQAVLTAFRPVAGQSVLEIFGMEVPSSTEWAFASQSEFVPVRFVDISAHLSDKIEAMRCYEMEMRPFPHPRSVEAIEALARWRGASAGCMAAEAFTVLRQTV